MNFLKKLFGGKKTKEPIEPEFSQEQYDKDYEDKMQGLENVLGKSYEMVGHAIIPFAIGGAVDMYYFPDHIKGTGFATMELLDPDGNGPKPNSFGTYELVSFTKEPLSTDRESSTPFNSIERRVCGIFTAIGNFSFQAVLNPLETCEIPSDKGENQCLVFYKYSPDGKEFTVGARQHHLLLCLEVFRTEMEFAREYGTEALIAKLKQAGYYPYSDLDRDPVA